MEDAGLMRLKRRQAHYSAEHDRRMLRPVVTAENLSYTDTYWLVFRQKTEQ